MVKTIAREAANYMEEFRQGNVPVATNPRQVGQIRTPWHPPRCRWYKINTERAVFKVAGHCGVGVVI